MLRVLHVEGEPTRYRVESNSRECLSCGRLFNWLKRPGIRIGGACPRCGGVLDVRFHLVDLVAYNGSGQCSCEFFSFVLGPKVSRCLPHEQGDGKFRCSHIDAARDFFADTMLKAHEADRYAKAGKQREEDAA